MFISAVLILRYIAFYVLEYALMFIFKRENPEIRFSEGMSEVSTAGLISVSFALGTKNMDLVSLISAYVFF